MLHEQFFPIFSLHQSHFFLSPSRNPPEGSKTSCDADNCERCGLGCFTVFSFDNRKLEFDWFLLLTSSCSGEHVESFERSRTSTIPGSAARKFARLL